MRCTRMDSAEIKSRSQVTGQSRVAIHRSINALLAEELQGGVHAPAIEAKAALPAE